MATISSIALPGGSTYGLNSAYCFEVTTPSFSSLPKTFYSSSITANHKVVGNAVHLSNPKAGDINWTITCANGSLTISGTFHGTTSTTATMSLWIPAETITLTSS